MRKASASSLLAHTVGPLLVTQNTVKVDSFGFFSADMSLPRLVTTDIGLAFAELGEVPGVELLAFLAALLGGVSNFTSGASFLFFLADVLGMVDEG